MGCRWKIAQILEYFWWKIYLSLKDREFYTNWKKSYWHEFLQKINLNPDPNEKMLDAGCGPAGIFMVFPHEAVTAVDPLLGQYEKLQHFESGNYPNVEFVEDRLELFRRPGLYDTIFCLNAINHVDDIAKCLGNLMSCLNEDGTLVMSVDVHKNKLIEKVFQMVPFDILHPQQYRLEGYLDLLSRSNAFVVKYQKLSGGMVFNYYVIIAKKGNGV